MLGPLQGSGHVLQVGDVGQGRRHLQEQVRCEPGARHHPQVWCELEPVRLSELISRHPVQMFLIQLIHSLRVTFNSVKVCHCFSPQTQHPVTVSKNKIFILMLGNIFSFKLYYCESSLNHIIDPFLEVCQDVQRKISSLLTSVFVWWREHLTLMPGQYSPGAVRRNWHNWLITSCPHWPGHKQTQTGVAGTCQRMQTWAEQRSIDVALDFNAVVCLWLDFPLYSKSG